MSPHIEDYITYLSKHSKFHVSNIFLIIGKKNRQLARTTD